MGEKCFLELIKTPFLWCYETNQKTNGMLVIFTLIEIMILLLSTGIGLLNFTISDKDSPHLKYVGFSKTEIFIKSNFILITGIVFFVLFSGITLFLFISIYLVNVLDKELDSNLNGPRAYPCC